MNESKVYTIGAYEEAFAQGKTVTKLGPLSAANVPPVFPKSFLEKDGSYAGGEVFDSIERALATLKEQLSSEILPKELNWHIYLLEADFQKDTYELHPNDFRIKHTVNVLKRVSNETQPEIFSSLSRGPK